MPNLCQIRSIFRRLHNILHLRRGHEVSRPNISDIRSRLQIRYNVSLIRNLRKNFRPHSINICSRRHDFNHLRS